MDQHSDSGVAARMDRLERENRRFKRFGIVAATIAVVIATAGAFREEIPKEVKANSFVVVDEAGRERGLFEAAPDGCAHMMILGKDGKLKAALGEEKENVPSLVLYDPKEIGSARLVIKDDGSPDFALVDSTGFVRVALELKKGGISGFRLFDEHGKSVGNFVQDGRGQTVTPVLNLNNEEQKTAISLGFNDKGSQRFFYSRGDQTQGLWQVDPEKGSSFAIAGPDGKGNITVRVAPDGSPSLNMTDKDGKVIFQAPKP
jgi:hypothetical protein